MAKDIDGDSVWTAGDGARDHRAMDASMAVIVGGVFALAGGVKGLTGMGLPTVAMSLLGLVMAPASAAVLLVAPSLATNVAQCMGPYARSLAARLWPTWIALALSTVFTPSRAAGSGLFGPQQVLGVVLVVYGAWGLWRPAVPGFGRHARWVGFIVGGLTGALTAETAVFVFPLVPYLQSLKLDKAEMVQALGLSFIVATLALALRLQAGGTLTLISMQSVVPLVAAFAGMWVGSRLRDRISATAFQRSLFVVFVALGAVNLLRSS